MQREYKSLFISAVLLGAMFLTPVAFAQSDNPPTSNPALQLTTKYPSLVIGIDETFTLSLTLRTETEAQIVDLSVQGLSSDWTTSFRGGGRTVRSVYVEPGENASVDLRIEPPSDLEAGTYHFEVVASGDEIEARLPIQLVVQEKTPASLAFKIELPTLRGKPSTTFRYNVTLVNEGDEDLTVDLFAQAPPVFRVTFKTGGQEVTSIPLEANGSKSLSVEAEPLLNNIAADSYPIDLLAQAGDVSTTTEVVAEVVGQSSLTLTTPEGRLSGRAEAGDETTFTLLVQNSGSAAAQGIALSATQPSGWTVEFEPKAIAQVEPGQQVEVTAHVRPAEKALAGDYVITFRAQPENDTSDSIDFRVIVRTSTLWGIVGIGLIAISVGVVGWAVMRFGRR